MVGEKLEDTIKMDLGCICCEEGGECSCLLPDFDIGGGECWFCYRSLIV
jgi:hypothetical protein